MQRMNDTLNVRLKPAERELYERAAAADKRRMSDWVRLTLCNAARELVSDPELLARVDEQVVR